ncbi:MAG: PqqD family protein [Acidobacteriota bacterium]|nr:MAG: PqqD family protein [Acidobacteriota bacterium]
MEQRDARRPERDDRWRRNPRLADQTLGGKAVVLHYEGRRILGLNESGTLVWNLLDGRRSIGQLVDALAAHFGLPAREIDTDVLEFVRSLADRDLLVSVEGGEQGPEPGTAEATEVGTLFERGQR